VKPTNPVDHVVMIVKENHTFDNYFGTFPGANGDATLQHAADPRAAWKRFCPSTNATARLMAGSAATGSKE
jgi:phospholipase C